MAGKRWSTDSWSRRNASLWRRGGFDVDGQLNLSNRECRDDRSPFFDNSQYRAAAQACVWMQLNLWHQKFVQGWSVGQTNWHKSHHCSYCVFIYKTITWFSSCFCKQNVFVSQRLPELSKDYEKKIPFLLIYIMSK